MSIIGIKVNVTLSGGNWSPTKDPLYLGIYSENGGREFALKVDGITPLTNPGSDYSMLLGAPCCPNDEESSLRVDLSQNNAENDPLLNPISLNEVKFIYIRKYGGRDQNNDDATKISSISVLLCNEEGDLRRFKKTGHLFLTNEAGQQHWLKETSVPGCRLTVKLNKVFHKDEARNPAGYNWKLKWLLAVAGNSQWSNTLAYRINRSSEPDEWTRTPNTSISFFIPGCCAIVPFALLCQSIERDWPSRDDIGTNFISSEIDCSATNQFELSVNTLVEGNSRNRKSLLTYFFSITAECIE